MYPIQAVLVNCADTRPLDLRHELADLSVTVAAEFATVDEILRAWSTPPERRLFVVRVQGLKQVAATGKLADAFPGFPILALIDGNPDANGLYALNRAGAAQMLPFPPQAEELGLALDRLTTQFGLRVPPARILMVTGAAPGCGVTFLSVNLAAEFANQFHVPTTLAELSFGFGRLPGYLGLSPPVSVRDLLALSDPPPLSAVRAALSPSGVGFQLLAGPHRQVDPFTPSPGRVSQLLGMLRRATPLTVVDVPPVFDAAFFEALTEADRVVLVGRQEVATVQALKIVRESLFAHGVKKPVIVLNSFDPDLDAFTAERVGGIVGCPDPWIVSRDAAAARLASDAGKPVAAVAARSPSLTDTRKLAAHLLGELGYPLPPQTEPAPRPSFLSRLFGE